MIGALRFSGTITAVTSHADGSVLLWNLSTGTLEQRLNLKEPALCIALVPDTRSIAVGNPDGTIHVLDLRSGSAFRSLSGHTKEVWCMAFSPDGALLATASADMTVRVFNFSSGAKLEVLPAQTEHIRSIVWLSDATKLAAASLNGKVRVWNAVGGAFPPALSKIAFPEVEQAMCLAVRPDGSAMAFGSPDGAVTLVDMPSGRRRRCGRCRS